MIQAGFVLQKGHDKPEHGLTEGQPCRFLESQGRGRLVFYLIVSVASTSLGGSRRWLRLISPVRITRSIVIPFVICRGVRLVRLAVLDPGYQWRSRLSADWVSRRTNVI